MHPGDHDLSSTPRAFPRAQVPTPRQPHDRRFCCGMPHLWEVAIVADPLGSARIIAARRLLASDPRQESSRTHATTRSAMSIQAEREEGRGTHRCPQVRRTPTTRHSHRLPWEAVLSPEEAVDAASPISFAVVLVGEI